MVAVAAAASAAPAEAAAGAQGGQGAAEVLPPADPLARYLERVIPDAASARQWLADHAPHLPADYRDRLLAENPSLAPRTGPEPPAASGQSSIQYPDITDVYDGETFAYGALRSASPDGALRDQPGITVCLVDRLASGSFAPLHDVVTFEPACQATDASGTFWGHIFIYGDHGDPVDLWLNVSAAAADGNRVVDGAGRTYAAYVDASDDLDGYLTGLGATVMDGDDGMRRTFWILDSVALGREAAHNATGRAMPPLDITWLNDTRSRVPSSYDGTGMNMTVSSSVKRGASHGAEAYPASILHEYGHHVMRDARGATGSAGSGGAACSDAIMRPTAPACAWSEGWAHFFPALALDSRLLQYQEQRYPIDLEAAKWRVRGHSGAGFADGSAGRVASALWDLRDAANEGGDTVDNATAAVWASLYGTGGAGGSRTPATFSDFAAGWSRAAPGHPPLGSVMVLNGLASIPQLLAASAGTGRFHDGFESGTGSWAMSGGGNWRAVPAAGQNGSAALVSSGCEAAAGGCEATILEAINATGYARASLRMSLAGGPSSAVALQHSADGLTWANASSHNGTISGWRSVDVDAIRLGVEGEPARAYFRLVAFSGANQSAAVDDILIRADSAPAVSVAPSVRIGHDRLQRLAVGASDPDGDPVSLSLEIDGGAAASGVSASLRDLGNGTGIAEVRAAPSSAGNFTAAVSATAHGLSRSAPLAIAVDDVEPPAIGGDTGHRIAEATGLPATPVTLGPVNATDNHDPRPSLAHSRAPGGAYPLGTTIIRYNATDASGNSASILQNVTVLDTTRPAFGAVGPLAVRLGIGGAPAPVDYAVPAATDLEGPVPVSCDPPPGSLFSAGTTSVSCTASDGRGNTATASFAVTAAPPPALNHPSSPVPVSAFRMDNPRGSDAAEFNGSTYAAVAYSYPVWWYADGVMIVDITDPHRPAYASSPRDGHDGFGSLGGARDVALAIVDGGMYAAAVSASDGAIQVINATDPARPAPLPSLAVPRSSAAGDPGQGAAITSFKSGASTYVAAAVPGYGRGGGLYIANITDPASPVLLSSSTDGAGGFDTLAGASGVDVARIGSSTYAVVASSGDSGIQIVDITNPSSPVAVASARDGAGGFDELAGASSVAIARIGSSTYAVVASARDNGVQIINITDPASPTPAAALSDGSGGFEKLNGAADVAIASLGGATYAVVASPDFATSTYWYAAVHPDNGVQIVNITDPASPTPVAALSDGSGGFDELYTPGAVSVAAVGPALYAVVSSLYDDSLQIVGIGAAQPNLPPVVDVSPNATVLETGRLRHAVHAHDPNADRLNVTVSSSPPAPGLALSGDGAVVWTPGESQSGSYTVSVTAVDPHGASASGQFDLTVSDASVSHRSHDAFASSLGGWSYKQVWDPGGDRRCGATSHVIQYGMQRSSEHGGSAHVSGNGNCWKGSAGAARSVSVPPSHTGGDIRIDLEFRTDGTIYRTGSWTNNLAVDVTDSQGRSLADEPLYGSKRVPGQDRSGWSSATVYAEGVDSSACPCEVYVHLHDFWEMNHRQNFYLDNVNITVAKPAAVAAGAGGSSGAGEGASGQADAPPPERRERDAAAGAGDHTNGTRVAITDRIVYGTTVSLAWDAYGGTEGLLYDVVAVAARGDGVAASAIVAGTSAQLDGLGPNTRYEISVGVRGEPDTRSTVLATTWE